MRRLLLCAVIGCIGLHAKVDPLEGLWQGFDGEWGHVSKQLVALAEAIPADKYAWCPGSGSAIHQRSLDAHCTHELLVIEHHGETDVR